VRAKGETMWPRRLTETFPIITTDDGVLELLAPKQHSLLWASGPASVRKLTRFFADNPNYMCLLGLIHIGFSVWLAFRQYREE
jgi:hypothetical protein